MKKLLIILLILCTACSSAFAMEVTPAEPDGNAITQQQAIDLARARMLAAQPDYVSEYVMPQLDAEGQLDAKAHHAAVTHQEQSCNAWIVTFYVNTKQKVPMTASVMLDAASGEVLWEDYSYTALYMRDYWEQAHGRGWSPEMHVYFDELYASPLAPSRAVLPHEDHLPMEDARQIAINQLVKEYGVTPASLTDGIAIGYEMLEYSMVEDYIYYEWRISFYNSDNILQGQVNLDAADGSIHLTYSITDPGNG